MRKRFKTIDEAEDAFGITVDCYLESEKENVPAVERQQSEVSLEEVPEKLISIVAKLTGSQLSKLALHILEHLPALKLQWTLEKALPKALPRLSVPFVVELLTSLSKIASCEALIQVADSLVCSVASKSGLSWNLKGFLDTACRAMCELETHGRPNVVYFLCRCIAEKKEDGKTPLLPMDRMPFGLIQYQLEFFNATHVCQVIFVVFTRFLSFISE